MNISTRLVNLENDYELLSTWWVERQHEIIPKDFLSQLGVMCLIDNKPVGAMWLYPVIGCKWSMIRFPITTIKSSKEERDIVLNHILDSLFNISKDMGYSKVFCTTNHENLINKLEQYGMSMTSDNCKHFWGVI